MNDKFGLTYSGHIQIWLILHQLCTQRGEMVTSQYRSLNVPVTIHRD